MKLIVRVRPGVELTCASFCPNSELIRLDLPTLERPRKANSGGPAAGKCLGSAAEVRNLAMRAFIFFRCAPNRRRFFVCKVPAVPGPGGFGAQAGPPPHSSV